MKRNFGIVVLILAGFFIARVILNDIGNFISALGALKVEYLIGAFIFNCLFFYLRAFSWGYIVEALGKKIRKPEIAEIWFLSEATRYIPGKVWSFLAKVQLARGKGLGTKIGVASVLIEVILMLAVTCFISYAAILEYIKSINPFWIGAWLLGLGVVIVTGLAIPKIREKLISNLKRLKEIRIAYEKLILALFLQFLAWGSYGLAIYFLAINVAGDLNLATIVSVAVLSWLLGYLSLISPSGIGIREGALVVLLSPFMSPGQAAVVALLGRFIIVLTEAVNTLFWFFRKQRNQLKLVPQLILKHWSYILLGLFITAYVIVFSILSILRHNAFASNFDLANMSQTVWNTINGRPFELSGVAGTVSRFSIHADLILVLLSPFYLIWDKARMLLILQSLFLGLGAVPVYFLAQKVLNKKIISLTLVLVYLLNPGMQWTNIYDFHGVSLAIPFLLSAFYFAYAASREKNLSYTTHSIVAQKWNWYWLFVLLAITTKEQISLFIAMLGLVIFFIFKKRGVGVLTFILGIAWFLSMVFVFIPFFSPSGEHWALEWYKLPSEGAQIPTLDVLISRFTESTDVRDYYLHLLKPFAFLPLIGLPWLLLSLPELGINVLSSHAQMRTTVFHYDSGITPSLVIATIFGLGYIDRLLRIIKPVSKYANLGLYLAVTWLLLISFRVNYHYSPLPTTPSCWCWIYQVSEEDRRFDKILLTIPKDARVTSSGEIRAHLTQRRSSFNLPNATESADYIAILDQSRIVGDYRPKEFETKLVDVLNQSPEHELVEHFGHFYLYKRKDYLP